MCAAALPWGRRDLITNMEAESQCEMGQVLLNQSINHQVFAPLECTNAQLNTAAT
jgi:hypothetical protein